MPALVEAGLDRHWEPPVLQASNATFQGRGRPRLLELPGPQPMVLKSLRHGGVLGGLWNDRFLDSKRLRDTVKLHRVLCERGVPVPEVAFARVARARGGVRLQLATYQVRNSVDGLEFARAVADATILRRAAIAVGRALRLLHDAGVDHADLNVKNILLTRGADPRAYVIDLETSSLADAAAAEVTRVRNLSRLYRSMVKHQLVPDPMGARLLCRALYAYDAQHWRRLARAARRHFERGAWLHRISWRMQGRSGTRKPGND